MPPPKTKLNMMKQLGMERSRLEQNLARLSRTDMLQPGVVGEWSVKDVLAHLADWEDHMRTWVEASRRGQTVEVPEPGLTMKQLDVVNQHIYERHCDQPLDEVMAYFHAAHDRFMVAVDAIPEEEMLAPGRYAFTGKSPVYNWLASYAAHDRWAKTAIRKWVKANLS
jgi:hypothetical protein